MALISVRISPAHANGPTTRFLRLNFHQKENEESARHLIGTTYRNICVTDAELHENGCREAQFSAIVASHSLRRRHFVDGLIRFPTDQGCHAVGTPTKCQTGFLPLCVPGAAIIVA